MSNDLTGDLDHVDVRELLCELDGSGSIHERNALQTIQCKGGNISQYLYKCYHISKKAKIRAQCLFYLFSYAQDGNKYAISLGIKGLKDRAKIVRYNACKLLAYAQNKDTLVYLRKAELVESDESIDADIKASIDAIVGENHNWFVDRTHSGLTTMEIVDRLNTNELR